MENKTKKIQKEYDLLRKWQTHDYYGHKIRAWYYEKLLYLYRKYERLQ